MPGQLTIPKSSRLSLVGGIFKATFNAPTIGKYDFTNLKNAGGNFVNRGVPLGLVLNPTSIYFVNKLSFSMSIDEGVFLSSIDTTTPDTIPNVNFRPPPENINIYNYPLRLLNYFDNRDIDSFFIVSNAKDILAADFRAVLNQTADLVGIGTVYAQVSICIYEINDYDFKSQFTSSIK
jgi:hypothetical protein